MRRQRAQVTAFKFKAARDGVSLPGHNALLIDHRVLSEALVNGFQISALWERHEVIPPGIPNQILDTAFLPSGGNVGKEGLKAVDTVEVHKHVVLSSAMTL